MTAKQGCEQCVALRHLYALFMQLGLRLGVPVSTDW
jgi:hypothetical protein